MRAIDALPRIAEVAVKAARQSGSFALSLVRTVAARRRSGDETNGWTRAWEPASSRPVGEPPPPPGVPRRPVAAPPAPAPAAPARPAAASVAAPPAGAAPAPAPPAPVEASAPAPPPAAPPAPAPPTSAPPAPVEAPAPPAPPAPAHIDRDAVVVAASADADAADGASPEVNVAEPWKGYSRLTAKDVRSQLVTADAATLAVVRLYESSHGKRRTVLADVDRRLARADG